jgi:enoyl-CoA hydratase/carnithine racemase
MSDRIKLTVKDEMAQVRLDRPDKRNALDLEMFKAIAAVQKRLRRSHELKAVVLSGAGIDFCSGLDVKSAMHDRRGMVRLGASCARR